MPTIKESPRVIEEKIKKLKPDLKKNLETSLTSILKLLGTGNEVPEKYLEITERDAKNLQDLAKIEKHKEFVECMNSLIKHLQSKKIEASTILIFLKKVEIY